MCLCASKVYHDSFDRGALSSWRLPFHGWNNLLTGQLIYSSGSTCFFRTHKVTWILIASIQTSVHYIDRTGLVGTRTARQGMKLTAEPRSKKPCLLADSARFITSQCRSLSENTRWVVNGCHIWWFSYCIRDLREWATCRCYLSISRAHVKPIWNDVWN